MIQFVVVMMIFGIVASYLFDTDTAIKVGLKVMDWWILASLAMVVFTSVFNILSVISAIFLRLVRLFISRQ